MDVDSAMDTFAERYEAVLVPTIFEPWAKELIRRAAPKDGEHILDLACGTGAVSRNVIAAGVMPGRLTGADISPDMLAVARRRAEAAGIAADWAVAPADALPFADDSFDVAFCQQALQFFPDRPAALGELKRVMRPGGRVAFCVNTDLGSNPLLAAQAATLDAYLGTEAGDTVRAICGLPDGEVIGALFDAAGFGAVEVERVSLSLGHPDAWAFAEGALGGMHTGDKLANLPEAVHDRCVHDFIVALDDCVDGTTLSFPHVSHVVTAAA